MSKTLVFDREAREKISVGVTTLARAVKTTLGPRGRNVMITSGDLLPRVTKDGVSVAKQVVLSDPAENAGARMVMEAASRTNDEAGDGTTTATVLAEAIYIEGLSLVAAGNNPVAIKRGIDKAVAKVTENLRGVSRDVDTSDQIFNVATISANGDTEVGQIITDAMDKIGRDGVITVDEFPSSTTHLEVVEGMQFDRGYINPHFLKGEQQEVVFTNCRVLLLDKRVSAIDPQFHTILSDCASNGYQLLIVADDMEGPALQTVLMNTLRGSIQTVVVRAPSFGDNRRESLLDIAAMTGAKVVCDALGNPMTNLTTDWLGSAKKVTVGRDHTTIVGSPEFAQPVSDRAKIVRAHLAEAKSLLDREKLQERLARLVSGVAIIRLAAATEAELKERKDRVEDALHATRAAVSEGIVPGGGVALLRATQNLRADRITSDRVEQMGVDIVLRACKAPLHAIARNAGLEPGVVEARVLSKRNPNHGYDAASEVYGDLIKMGVIDPVKVTRVALTNAASVASMLLTTDCIITESAQDIEL